HAGLVPGSVVVDDDASFASPWPPSAYEVDAANGRIRFLAGGGITNPSQPQNVHYAVQGGTGRTAPLRQTFRKLLGAQDRGANDGSLVDSVTLPGRDAILLLRPAYADAHPAVLLDDQDPEFALFGPGWTTRGWDTLGYEITGAGNNRYGPTFR